MSRWRSLLADGVCLGSLAVATLLLFWALVGTNLVLAGVDAFTYFVPYRDFASAALRQGRLPLWNPYLFMGVPFLANMQAGVLYPFNWALMALSAAKSLGWTVVLHTWLAAIFTYGYARTSIRLGRPGAWLAAAAFAFSGFLGGQVEHVNQLSAGVWLPLLFWLFDVSMDRTRRGPGDTSRRISWLAVLALGVAVSLQLLAGHTQSAYISLVGLGTYSCWPLIDWAWCWLRRRRRCRLTSSLRRELGQRWVIYLASLALGFGLAAAQLLPTLELSQLSARSGGISYREAVSFSLKPRMILYTLLPTYAEDLGQAFSTPAFSEFIGYIGVVGVVLAMLGGWQGRATRSRRFFLVLSGLGLLLALGIYNPLYYALFKLVPGFDLFRAPARWMLLYVFGAAMLAGIGLDWLALACRGPLQLPALFTVQRRRQAAIVCGSVVLLVCLLLSWVAKPAWPSWAGWGGTLAIGAAVLLSVRRIPSVYRWQPWMLALLLLLELIIASRWLPHANPTAPEAIESLRTAPSHLLSDDGLHRFLSLSDITYDPGDLLDLEHLFGQQLSRDAMYDLVVASKQQEILAPNLPLLHRIQAVDGYGGGILPLARYILLQRLLLDEADISPDGRLREQLQSVPRADLLDLFNVKYVITDKLLDVWVDDVYYDLQNSAVLGVDGDTELVLTNVPALSSTALGIVAHVEGGRDLPDHCPVAEIVVGEDRARSERLLLRAGEHTAEGVWDDAVSHARPQAVDTRKQTSDDPRGQEYLAILQFTAPREPSHISVRSLLPAGRLVLRGLTLIDGRTGAHDALSISQGARLQRVHSGDVKVYENTLVLPRAFVVHKAVRVADDAGALQMLLDPGFSPAESAVLLDPEDVRQEMLSRPDLQGDARQGEGAVVQVYEPERVVVEAILKEGGYLVLSDAKYPGWKAWVDGEPVSILSANLLMRAVPLGTGQHLVEFRFEPESLRWGVAISLASLILLVIGGGICTAHKWGALAGRKPDGGV